MKDRSYARELAMQELYRLDLLKESPPPSGDLRTTLGGRAQKREVVDFALQLIEGTLAHQKWIDETLKGFLQNWNIDRLSIIDRQLLRMAVYEFFFCEDVPFPVIINEAIELAKRFGSEKSSSFINGILDRIHSQKDKLSHTIPSEN